MDNKAIAGILYETADLLEIDGQDSFRIRSYRNAAEAVEAAPEQIADLIGEPKKVLAIPGIGKGMLANFQQLLETGKLGLHAELLKKYRPSMLELLRVQGLGPKTIALIWSAYQVCDIEGIEKLAREGKIRELPRMGEKHEQKLLKALEDYRRIGGRFLLDAAEVQAEKIVIHLSTLSGIEKITRAGSLRRGRETVGDLDILVTGPGCCDAEQRQTMIRHMLKLPGLMEVIAQGENKLSFRMRGHMQVDVRFLPPESFGAAMQYFTGSKAHNVALRQRALKLGYTLSEYSLTRLDDNEPVAGRTEEEIYTKLGLDFIPPELRENQGEIAAAESHTLPLLIQQSDIRGDVHMHTVETDGRCTIDGWRKPPENAAMSTWPSPTTPRTLHSPMAWTMRVRSSISSASGTRTTRISGIKIFAGIEVDILADGTLDLSDAVLSQMDVVIASVHSYFNQTPEQMTRRLQAAISNPRTSLIGHPTGRLLLRRDAYHFDVDAVLDSAAAHHVAMELNAYPDRLDLCDRHLRLAKQKGVKIVINTDSHHTSHLDKMRYGILQARRAGLTREDVLNTLPADQFASAVRRSR